MRILLFASAYNGLCQRVDRELLRIGHQVFIELSANPEDMIHTVDAVAPDLIICPFLKHRVPDCIWQSHTCWIVHPGIEGDRGPSSLDWAIAQERNSWGVTLLQADAEMDAGDIWGTRNFPVREASKGSLYRREVVSSAMFLIKRALADFERPEFRPRPLDYSRPHVEGECLPLMRQTDRAIEWPGDDTDTVLKKIRSGDGFPGVKDTLGKAVFYLFGAERGPLIPGAEPGDVVGRSGSAICRATTDGSVWIRQLKEVRPDGGGGVKQPAVQALASSASAYLLESLPVLSRDEDDVRVRYEGAVAYVYFDFYNGAMSTEQCRSLLATLRLVADNPQAQVVVLMGGEDFWSNGIHLNCIEVAESPAEESWRNINAMNDVVEWVLTNRRQWVVAALRNNAGAGGALLSQACDSVVARSGVVLNPHYATMGLYGSEYWTYTLPRRVGKQVARSMIEACQPILTDEAQELGMVDELLPEAWEVYHDALSGYCQALLVDESYLAEALDRKRERLAQDEAVCPLAAYRREELRRMKATFDDPDCDYHRLRYRFVHKISCGKTPARLRRGAQRQAQRQPA